MRDYVVFSDVSKYYQMGQMVIKAIDHINFSIAKGEFCIIVGPSGAGKTTVMKMLTNLWKPTWIPVPRAPYPWTARL